MILQAVSLAVWWCYFATLALLSVNVRSAAGSQLSGCCRRSRLFGSDSKDSVLVSTCSTWAAMC